MWSTPRGRDAKADDTTARLTLFGALSLGITTALIHALI